MLPFFSQDIFLVLCYTFLMTSSPRHLQDLYQLLTLIEDQKEAALLFRELLTPQELTQIAERWQLVKMLDKGVTQREIAEKLNLSIATVTRGSKAFKTGKGFRYFLKKMEAGECCCEE
jgi:TrpR family trp operon transcriptional repressor